MNTWIDTALVIATIAAAVIYMLWRAVRRWRAPASQCGGDCCCPTKTQPDLLERASRNIRPKCGALDKTILGNLPTKNGK